MSGSATFWKAILQGGTPFVTRHHQSLRRLIYFRRVNYRYADVLWNAHHPDDLLGPDDVVHHKDLNTLNDSHVNLEKHTRASHAALHRRLEAQQRKERKEGKKMSTTPG